MRYPQSLKKDGTIGFIAPSFGCAIEPYQSRFENAIRVFRDMGYRTYLGPNCYEGSGIGISNTPSACGEELNRAMTDPELADVIITCGGGELMCEVVPYIDFEKIKNAPPKWYMGYSDNTNYTFLSATIADTAAIYGPCAPTFGRTPWHESVQDAMGLLTGEISQVSGYEMWERYEASAEDGEEEPDPILPYQLNTRTAYQYYVPDHPGRPDSMAAGMLLQTDGTPREGGYYVLSGDQYTEKVKLEGRLLGGCIDILTLLIGTKYDQVDAFLERYREDGIIWFLESCDLDMLSLRRAFWQMREAGWFRYAKGFLIGRPLHYGEDQFGVNQYNAVIDMIGELKVPIIMDLDIGHLPPMMPIICGSYANVEAAGNQIEIHYHYI